MNFHPDSNGEPLVEFNRCHGANDGKFCSDLTVHKVEGQVTADFHKGWGGDKDKTYYEYVKPGEDPTSYAHKMQLKGRPLTDEERANTILYHVTTDLHGVLASGKLIAGETGGGLGGGQHPAVSFTADRKAAKNIMDVMRVAKVIVNDANFEKTIRGWHKREFEAVKKQYGGYDNVPMSIIDRSHDAVDEALRTYKVHADQQAGEIAAQEKRNPGSTSNPDWQTSIRNTRANYAMDAFRTYLWGRDSAKLGENPIIFTSGVKLRDHVKTVGLIAMRAKHVPTATLTNFGADKFQSEIEVHGDVPMQHALYTTAGEVRRRGRRRK